MATLERVQRNLKRYRASVLKAAVEGRLVPTEAELAREEGRDYEPAVVLLERILKERRPSLRGSGAGAKMRPRGKPDLPRNDLSGSCEVQRARSRRHDGLPELPEGWCWATVEQMAIVTGGLTKNVKA